MSETFELINPTISEAVNTSLKINIKIDSIDFSFEGKIILN